MARRHLDWCVVALLLGLPAASAPATPTYLKVAAGEFPRTDYVGTAADLDGDGKDDLIVGSTLERASVIVDFGMPLPPGLPVDLLLSNGDGTFRDGTAELVVGDLPRTVGPPVPVVADFNGDGRPDVAIFDRGIALTNANYSGSPPILLLSGPDGRLHRSSALADAVAILHQQYPVYGQYGGPNLHVYVAVAGDIDNDGDLDIWVESCGGNNACSHFLVNNGDGTFTADEGRVSVEALRGPPGQFWRYWGAALADVDGDGFLDLVLGQLRESLADGRQDLATSAVFLNDRTGHFPSAGSIRLPQPDFNLAFTVVDSLAVADIDADGLKDIVLAHSRRESTDASVVPFTGRYIQILMNKSGGLFVDETLARMGDQSATTGQVSQIYPAICPGTTPCVPGGGGPLMNAVSGLTIEDVDGDGAPDLVMSHAYAHVGPEGPLVHLNDGTGRFTVLDPNLFTFGDLFVYKPIAMDVTGDGRVDFVYANAVSGAPTNTYVALVATSAGAGVPRPVVTITATTATASEASLGGGVFTVTRTGPTTSALTVRYAVGGTATAGSDYTTLPGSLTFGVGASTATIAVAPLQDAVIEPGETVIVTLIWSTAYSPGAPSTAKVTITDDDLLLTVIVRGSVLGGAVTGSGIGCPGDCTQVHDRGAVVTLTAHAPAGGTFRAWSGCTPVSGIPTQCTVTMSDARTVTARFSKIFTDEPLVAGVTPIKAAHLLEIFDALGALGLGPTWTGAAPAAERAVLARHMNDLGGPLGLPAIMAGETVRVSHVDAFRTAVRERE